MARWLRGCLSWGLSEIRLKTVWRVTGNCENIPSVQSLGRIPRDIPGSESGLSLVTCPPRVPCHVSNIMRRVEGDGRHGLCRVRSGHTKHWNVWSWSRGRGLRSRLQSLAPANNIQCTGHWGRHRPLRHRHLVLSESDQNPQSNAKVPCCLVTLSRRNTGTGRLRARVRLRHRFKCHLSVEGNEAFLLWV